jgi:mono/diheme cytochrome c family protein
MSTTVNNRKLCVAVLGVLVSLAGAALAQQKSIQLPADNPDSQLKPGAGVNVASLNCAICHSLDYIVRQPPMAPAQWEAEVHKMITVFGAPIRDADAKVIAEYLAANYAAPGAASAPSANPASPAPSR